ncbi:hypothetical protein SG34_007500 [Thalassomonas viridans]|uniref:Uncharacterized protein n=1 Tax=Thalassomonas viridans TaxID=137584 RepID=A0AAE9Z654_9GAMM|nr:hypothetical protein [Thalassomonas viridans]WDE06740.1 hypothetical protein SG34_007500 [Thalassomonas viridans]
MKIIEFFKKLLQLLLPGEPPVVELNAIGQKSVSGDVNEQLKDTCQVIASYRDGKPAAGVVINYAVISGPLQIWGNGATPSQAQSVKTDENGIARVNAFMSGQGHAIVAAELDSDANISKFFDFRSTGLTHDLFLIGNSCVSVDAGEISMLISAIDFYGQPVTGAELKIEGGTGADDLFTGTVDEVGNGVYSGKFQTQLAGEYAVSVYDPVARVNAKKCVHMMPGKASAFAFTRSTDPRAMQPYGEISLHVQLTDDFANPLNPKRIICRMDGQEVPVFSYTDTEAIFSIRASGYTHVDIQLTDSESDVAYEQTIPFAAAWLGDPGLVFEGDTFTTPLYGLPPVKRPATSAEIEIEYDPELVKFDHLLARGNEGRTVQTHVDKGTVTISIEASTPVHAEEHPDGIFIGECIWQCLGEGKSCFSLVGRMSPSTPKWKLCVKQKKDLKSCLCVNVIYKQGDNRALQQGKDAANEIPKVVSAGKNVKKCCPVLSVKVNKCAIGPADWRKVVGAVGANETVNNRTEMDALFDANICQRAKCINLMMIDINWNGWDGWTYYGKARGTNRGFGVIEPGKVGLRGNGNLGAHEICHALDLRHEGRRRDNLMSQNPPHGSNLTTEQCKKIFQYIDNYPC